MIIFAAATGLRPSELFGLDRRDVDRKSKEFETSQGANAASRGRSVDAAPSFCRLNGRLKSW
jgi:integrase